MDTDEREQQVHKNAVMYETGTWRNAAWILTGCAKELVHR